MYLSNMHSSITITWFNPPSTSRTTHHMYPPLIQEHLYCCSVEEHQCPDNPINSPKLLLCTAISLMHTNPEEPLTSSSRSHLKNKANPTCTQFKYSPHYILNKFSVKHAVIHWNSMDLQIHPTENGRNLIFSLTWKRHLWHCKQHFLQHTRQEQHLLSVERIFLKGACWFFCMGYPINNSKMC